MEVPSIAELKRNINIIISSDPTTINSFTFRIGGIFFRLSKMDPTYLLETHYVAMSPNMKMFWDIEILQSDIYGIVDYGHRFFTTDSIQIKQKLKKIFNYIHNSVAPAMPTPQLSLIHRMQGIRSRAAYPEIHTPRTASRYGGKNIKPKKTKKSRKTRI
jgi:hypothetical protein